MRVRSRLLQAFDWDLGASAAFALLGLAMCIHAWGFPGGTRGVPGPGFFPFVVGLLLIALSAALAATTRGALPPRYWAASVDGPVLARLCLILALLIVYVALWERVPFVVRTPLLLTAIYRVLGERWPRAVLLAVVLTASLAIVFQGLLSVQL